MNTENLFYLFATVTLSAAMVFFGAIVMYIAACVIGGSG